MRRQRRPQAPAVLAALALFLAAAPAAGFTDRPAFKVPFKFKAAGRNLPAAVYSIVRVEEGALVLKHAASGKEIKVPFTGRAPAAGPEEAGPRLVFDEVGDFVPSYTEYITVYVLSEVRLSAGEGYIIHTTRGAHKTRTILPEGSAGP